MATLDLSPYFSSMRSVGIMAGTLLVGIGMLPSFDTAAFTQAVTDLADGTKLIMKGGGALLVIGLPIWGIIKSRLSSKVADVKAAEPAQFAAAVAQIQPVEMVAAVKDLPAVKGVITSDSPAGQAIAAAVPGPTVVSAGTPEARSLATAGT